VLGEDHPAAILSMRGLALVYLGERRYDKAEPLLTRTMESSRRILGGQHPDTLANVGWLADLYLQKHRYPDAESLLREALRGYEKTRSDTWDRYNCQRLLGVSLAGQKKYQEAEPLLLSGYEGMRQKESTIPAAKRSELNQAGNRIVQLYRDWRKSDKAAEWRKKLR
jgi:eukaryotic-like serine/threonine-protein kinase